MSSLSDFGGGSSKVEKGLLNQSFTSGQEEAIPIDPNVSIPAVVSVVKEIPQTGVTNNDWNVAVSGTNYDVQNTAYSTTLTPSATTGDITLTLGAGSFTASDVGKTIEGNGGVCILTATNGSATVTTAFTSTATIASGDWTMESVVFDGSSAEVSNYNKITGYNLVVASYDSVSFSVAAQDTNPYDIIFNNDGTKMYILGYTNDSVYQYSLTTAFDLSTASYDTVSFSVNAQEAIPFGIAFNNDGTKMYILGNGSDSVHQYSLTTAFDLSTASYDSVSFSVAAQDTAPLSIAFNNDGTKMYILGGSNNSVFQYSLTTAFDLSTASYDSVSFSFTAQATQVFGIAFNNTGTKMYAVEGSNDSVHQYTLSTAFDLSTASYDSVSFSVSSQETNPAGITFNNDGTKMYMVGNASDSVHQYSVSSSTPYSPTSTYVSTITNSLGQIDSTFWTDINSASSTQTLNNQTVLYSFSTDERTTFQIVKQNEGARNIVRDNAGTWEVNTNTTYGLETWAAASENTVYGALSEAMTTANNQMPPSQLVAATDTDFPPLSDTLDLAITLYTDNAEQIPSSDGVALNYDANTLNQGAILDVDYEWEQPTETEVLFTSLQASNLRIRII